MSDKSYSRKVGACASQVPEGVGGVGRNGRVGDGGGVGNACSQEPEAVGHIVAAVRNQG